MSEGYEIELLEQIIGMLHQLERSEEVTQAMLREVLARLPLEVYRRTIGGSVTVTEG